jgi:hypothetical protein
VAGGWWLVAGGWWLVAGFIIHKILLLSSTLQIILFLSVYFVNIFHKIF